MIQTFTIPRYRVPSVNALMRMHWSKRARLAREAKWMVGYYGMDLVKAEGRRRVSIVIALPDERHKPDPDNVKKLLLDGCVSAGLLVDDSQRWAEVLPPRIEVREAWGVELTLEDIADA